MYLEGEESESQQTGEREIRVNGESRGYDPMVNIKGKTILTFP